MRKYTAPFVGKIQSCRFVDEANKTIEVCYGTPEEQHSYYVAVDSEDKAFQAILDEGWDLEKISEDTVRFNRDHSRAWNDVISAYINQGRADLKKEYEGLLKKKLDEDEETRPIEKNALMRTILERNEDEEQLFKLKLAIFDMDEMKKIKDRSGKLKVRKAKSIMATIAALHELLEANE